MSEERERPSKRLAKNILDKEISAKPLRPLRKMLGRIFSGKKKEDSQEEESQEEIERKKQQGEYLW